MAILGLDLGSDGTGGHFSEVKPSRRTLEYSSKSPRAAFRAQDHRSTRMGAKFINFAVQIMGETAVRALENAGVAPEAVSIY